MLKALIADDEPKIRRGLRSSINWNELGIEIAGEAEDGEIALEMAKEIKPDILLVDICMAFINGLEFIEKIKDVLPDSLFIIITGHDEFTYAQQSIKLKVFDYLLKPVAKEHLYEVISKAKDELIHARQKNKYINWADQQLKKNLPFLRERFLNEWVNDNITEPEVEEQIGFYKLRIEGDSGIMVVKVVQRHNAEEFSKEWDRQRIFFAVQSIVDDLVKGWSPHIVFRDIKDNVVAIMPITDFSKWNELGDKTREAVEQYLKQTVLVVQQKIDGGILGTPKAYKNQLAKITREENWTPVVKLTKNFIDVNYNKEELSLQRMAEEFNISPAYISKLLRQELGMTFIDYLTQVRIKKAIQFMEDPFIKLYEVAEKVGYSTQQYFCTAFKRELGVTPAEYKKGGRKQLEI